MDKEKSTQVVNETTTDSKPKKTPAKKKVAEVVEGEAAATEVAAKPKKAPAKKKVAEVVEGEAAATEVAAKPKKAPAKKAAAKEEVKAEVATAAAEPKKAEPKKEVKAEPKKEAKAEPKKEVKAEVKKQAPAAPSTAPAAERNRLKRRYNESIVKDLQKELGLKNINEVPRLEKIVLNMGLGDAKDNSKSFNIALAELSTIAGQKAVITKAKKSVANFKVRQNMNVGAKVTLRGNKMYEFLDKLVSIALPRVRDFRGVSAKSFDGRGNYAMGIKEQLIFPEISYDKIEKVRGFDVAIITTAKNDEHAKALLTKLGMPFRNN